jgi:6-phosphogluconolactonase
MELNIARVDQLQVAMATAFEERVAAARLACGLSGGGTALLVLSALRAARVDWSRVALFWVDERAVDPDDHASNFGVARRMLLDPLGSRGPAAFPVPVEHSTLAEAARVYDDTLAAVLRGEPLDLAILGAGEDGHVASLFPGHPALGDTMSRVLAVEDAPKAPPRRITLSLSFLIASRHVWVVAVGERKRPVLQAAVLRTRDLTPLDRVLQQARHVTVFTDQVIRHR